MYPGPKFMYLVGMPPTVAALLAVALVAAEPSTAAEPRSNGELIATQVVPLDEMLGALPAEQLQGVVLDALPPPPDRVKRVTRYYGTVTVDHRAHLKRHAACKACHGQGAITKLEFTPKVAHDRCVGCHRQEAKGPVDCRGCHQPTPPPPEVVAKATADPLPAPVVPAGPDPVNLAAALAAFEPPKDAEPGVLGKEEFHRWIEVGLAAGRGQGISVRVASHQNFVVVTQSVERMMSSSDARTLGLLGAGFSKPVHSKVSLEAVGLAGFDAIDRPIMAFLPSIGARAGIEWRPRFHFFQQVTASVTGIWDLSTRHAFDREVGGRTIYGTVATGFTFPPR
jgi:hypothetical protein